MEQIFPFRQLEDVIKWSQKEYKVIVTFPEYLWVFSETAGVERGTSMDLHSGVHGFLIREVDFTGRDVADGYLMASSSQLNCLSGERLGQLRSTQLS